MNGLLLMLGAVLIYGFFTLASCTAKQEKPAAPAQSAQATETKAPPPEKAQPEKASVEKAPEEKAKPIKAKGDVGLLDLEKNYMILVTKEGKLITLDFSEKTKVTKIEPTDTKMEDIGLGSSATIEYQSKEDKKVATKIEYRAAKSGE